MSDLYEVRISKKASADLDAIHAFIANDSPSNAATMIAQLVDAFDKLTHSPHRSLFRRESKKAADAVRTLPVDPYVIYFRVLDSHRVVNILTIRHGARRRPRRFP
jgi:plasmid stabilization system protein ParE